MAAVPSIFFGPLAGALVDRWDRRRTMIACDLVRAGLVLLVPVVVEIHIGLVFLIAFLVATVGLLFRPAKNVVIPAIVEEKHLVTANSAASLTETLADVAGYPVAAAMVAVVGTFLAAAFVMDAGTYVISAVLILMMTLPPDDTPAAPFRPGVIWREMGEGLRFLVRQRELFWNTVISTLAMLSFGAEIVGSFIYAERVLDQSVLPFQANYGWMMASLGLGSVFGGLAMGWLGGRLPKGLTTLVGFIVLGLVLVGAGLTTNPFIAIGLFFWAGFANLLFLVPTITLFQERTPSRMFGRVVSTRQALTFGAMSISMAATGWLTGVIGAAEVLVAGGMLCAGAGLIGLLVPAMRDAR
jgi:MFS family permease